MGTQIPALELAVAVSCKCRHHSLGVLLLWAYADRLHYVSSGGGLSGLSAAHTLIERGGNVLVLGAQSCCMHVIRKHLLTDLVYRQERLLWRCVPCTPPIQHRVHAQSNLPFYQSCRQFHKGNVRYQRCRNKNTARSGCQRLCKVIL